MNESESASTRQRLILHARRLFAEKGYDATSVREITRSAGANLGAITYHFGSKAALYDAVLAEVFAPITKRALTARPTKSEEGSAKGTRTAREGKARRTAATKAAEGDATDPIGVIERLVATAFEAIAASPDVQLLILQQVVVQKAMPAAAQKELGALISGIAAEIEAGQRAGRIRAGDPVLMAVSVVSQPAYFSLIRRFAPARLVADGRAAPGLAEITRHAQQFIRSALEAGQERE